jgi:hypothetical protein
MAFGVEDQYFLGVESARIWATRNAAIVEQTCCGTTILRKTI